MLQVPGYTITSKILEGSSTVIYRASQAETGLSVVLKVSKGEYPTPRELATFRQECLLLRSLNIPGVVKTFGVQRYGNGLALILEDLPGQSLAALIRSQSPSLEVKLRIAIKIVEILQGIHSSGITHRDVKPHNLIVDMKPEGPTVHLIDFGSATRVTALSKQAVVVPLLESSLAYTSPEQTGRMNRTVDHRTDFYSLGVTLYELLTGTLPFTAIDPMELVHSHIARLPLPPHQLSPAIPEALSALVMKLLAKAPEDRYQSAYGVRADLEICLAEWQQQHAIAPFVLGQRDHSTELRLSQKLYGRNRESAALLAAFDRAQQGAGELVLLAGSPGVGKSALGAELGKVVVPQGALFAQGRFEQTSPATPYSALVQAFRDLCQQLLSESPEQLLKWRESLAEALGQNGRLISDLVPELELVFGEQPALAKVGLSEAQNRFYLVVQSFLRVFASAEHPLVMFIDDLQWADTASVGLLQALLTDPLRSHLLLVGTYRQEEIGKGHPLHLLLDSLRDSTTSVQTLHVPPLQLEDVQELLVDLLAVSPPKVEPLAYVLFEKTHGNPFFVNQCLLTLHAEGLLRFDFSVESWQWSLPEIQARQVTDNVVTFTVGKIRLLPQQTQRVLQLAACIGNQFDLEILTKLGELSTEATASALWDSLREGLCVPVEADARLLGHEHKGVVAELDLRITYRFLHDRVQQAAYSLLAAQELPTLHLQIARLLLQRTGGQVDDGALFELANHLLRGASVLKEEAERKQASRLHLRVGKRAKLSTAYQAAANHLQAGINLLGEDCWDSEYEHAVELHVEQAECCYLSGSLEQAEAIFEVLLPRLRSNLDHVRVAALRIELYATKGAMAKALAVGLEGLARFGVTFPESPPEQLAAMGAAVGEFKTLIGDRSLAALAELPACSDPQQLLIQRLLLGACTPAFFLSPTLMALLVMKLATLSLRHGNTEVTSYAHVSYAVIAGNVLGNYAEAYEFGQLGLAINKKFNNYALECRLNGLFAGFINIYQRPLHSSLDYLQAGIKAGLETGDFTFVGYCCFHIITQLLGAGDELALVSQEIDRLLMVARRAREPFAIATLQVLQQAILNLSGQLASVDTLSGRDFDEEKFLASIQQTEFTTLECLYYSIKLQLAYLYRNYEAAQQWLGRALSRVAGAMGLHFVTDLHFYGCLTLAALGHLPSDEPGPGSMLTSLLRQMELWAKSCPANYRHKHVLVLAELARLRGGYGEALDLYDQAIALAQQSEFGHHAALGSELCGRFLQKQGRSRLASVYIRDAYYGYERWGATQKLTQLAAEHPSLQRDVLLHTAREPVSPTVTTSSSLTASSFLDLATVLHAAQSIASEIVLDRLLEQVLRLVAANAGAQRGFLLLDRDGTLTIEASITVNPDVVKVGLAIPLEQSTELLHSIVQRVAHTREALVLGNASSDSRYANDPYVLAHKPKSLLCLALKVRGRVSGVLYLENNVAEDTFTAERIELLRLLSGQAATAVENAILYSRVKEFGDRLRESNDELRRTNTDLMQRTHELAEANERTQKELAERVRIEQERANLQEEVIRIQSARLAEIAAPLIPISDQIMVLPLIGTMDTARAQQVIETVLDGAQHHRARVVILDITGMKHVDTNVASMLLRAASALRLLGTQAVLTGIRAEIAQTLISLGVDLSGVVTLSTLQSGIAYAASRHGVSTLSKLTKSR